MKRTPEPIRESDIYPAGPNVWYVNSRTTAGKKYRVNWIGTGYVCECPHFQAHRGMVTCAHIKAVSDLQASKRDQARMLEMAGAGPVLCSKCGRPYGDNKCMYCNPDVHTIVPPARKKVTLESLYEDVA
jgi:hypothetical protein